MLGVVAGTCCYEDLPGEDGSDHGANFVRVAEQAIKEQRSHMGYLEALLTMESEERATGTPFSNGCAMPSCRG